jgi:hypothetical protein
MGTGVGVGAGVLEADGRGADVGVLVMTTVGRAVGVGRLMQAVSRMSQETKRGQRKSSVREGVCKTISASESCPPPPLDASEAY